MTFLLLPVAKGMSSQMSKRYDVCSTRKTKAAYPHLKGHHSSKKIILGLGQNTDLLFS